MEAYGGDISLIDIAATVKKYSIFLNSPNISAQINCISVSPVTAGQMYGI